MIRQLPEQIKDDKFARRLSVICYLFRQLPDHPDELQASPRDRIKKQ
jgi:hypothetical protein